MGMPAARITDMHVCPMITVLVPHVGGPILPPGGIPVLIGGLPAARVTDMAVCVGPPDVIVLAGEVQARSAVRGQLPLELADITVETERGGLDSNASDDSLTEQLLQIAEEKSAARAEQAVDKFKSGLAHGLAVTGSQSVRHAAERGAVETLLLEEDAPASTES